MRTPPRCSCTSSSASRTSMRCLLPLPHLFGASCAAAWKRTAGNVFPISAWRVSRLTMRWRRRPPASHRDGGAPVRARLLSAWIVAAALIVASIVGALVYSRFRSTESRLLVRASIPLAERSRVRRPTAIVCHLARRHAHRVPDSRRRAASQPSVERSGELRHCRNRGCPESLCSLPTANGSRSSSGPR